jgi:hypothetical protein
MRWLPSSIIIISILQGINVIDPSLQKIKKLWWLPKIEGSILKFKVPPFWPTYTRQRWTTLAKVHGLKVRSGMEENKLGNTLGTWEIY